MSEKMNIACYYLSKNDENNFIDLKTNKNMANLAVRYSYAKYGSIKDIRIFSKIIVNLFFQEINNPKSKLIEILNIARKNNDNLVLMTPGYRNVKSMANIMFDIALPYINIKLSTKGLPIIAKLKLPRLANPTENYSCLSMKERKRVANITDHILPGSSFYENRRIHIFYGDDILITGSSSSKACDDTISKGAKSFISIFFIIMDSQIALSNPSIEENLNLYKVTGNLDNTAKYIFSQNNFIPVLKSLKIILDKGNLQDLPHFLKQIPINNCLKLYIAYMTNESQRIKNYVENIDVIKKYLIEQNQLTKDGNLK